jgi:hypothetical protein
MLPPALFCCGFACYGQVKEVKQDVCWYGSSSFEVHSFIHSLKFYKILTRSIQPVDVEIVTKE